jgi:hypothetical protein
MGSELPFAAICMSDRSADKVSFRCKSTNFGFEEAVQKPPFGERSVWIKKMVA